MSYKTGAFFDFDGTIADSLGAMYQCYEKFVVSIDGKPSISEFQSLNGPPLAIVVERICASHNVPFNPQMIEDYNRLIDRVIENCLPVEGVIEAVTTAHQLGFTCAVVTSNSRQRVQNWLAKNDLDQKIEFIIAGDSTKSAKPHPHPYLLALEKAAIEPHHAFAVEDSKSGVTSATGAGIKTFWFAEQNVEPIENSIWIDKFAKAVPYLEELATKARKQ